jgi:hypothetical protein
MTKVSGIGGAIRAAAGIFRKKTPDASGTAVLDTIQQIGKTVETFNPAEQSTRRHTSDMLADSKLSKAVRPITILTFLALFTAQLILNWLGKETDVEYKELTFWGLMLVLAFYFPGRDLIKAKQTRSRK